MRRGKIKNPPLSQSINVSLLLLVLLLESIKVSSCSFHVSMMSTGYGFLQQLIVLLESISIKIFSLASEVLDSEHFHDSKNVMFTFHDKIMAIQPS